MSNWDCIACTFSNSQFLSNCEVCGTINQVKDSAVDANRMIPSTVARKLNNSDDASLSQKSGLPWSCPHCTFQNSIYLTQCEVCQASNLNYISPPSEATEKPNNIAFATANQFTSTTVSTINDTNNRDSSSSSSSSTGRAVYQRDPDNSVFDLLLLVARAEENRHLFGAYSNMKQTMKNPPICPLPISHARTVRSSSKFCNPPCTFISQKRTVGSAWSCGYRNIQMLCTSLMHVDEFRQKLFNGCGKIPDIHGLQRYIEDAWLEGFDAMGAAQFGGRLVGKKEWIGTTEAAALLRYFGLRAIIVDFESTSLDLPDDKTLKKASSSSSSSSSSYSSSSSSSSSTSFMSSSSSSSSGLASISGVEMDNLRGKNGKVEKIKGKLSAKKRNASDREDDDAEEQTGKNRKKLCTPNKQPSLTGHRVFIWMQDYFQTYAYRREMNYKSPALDVDRSFSSSSSSATALSSTSAAVGVSVSDNSAAAASTTRDSAGVSKSCPILFPLYFQHQGHSRTIVGVQVNEDLNRAEAAYVFDPGCDAAVLQRNLTLAMNHSDNDRRSTGTSSDAGCGGDVSGCVREGGKYSSNSNSNSNSSKIRNSGKSNGSSSSMWKRQLRKELHTMNKTQYQILYVAPGLMSAAERERSKVLIGTTDAQPFSYVI